jgi:hypothetical protein
MTTLAPASASAVAIPRPMPEAAPVLHGGFTLEEAGKIAGGNYMRIFRTAVG